MIISNMSVPIMGMADTAMLGHLEQASFLAAATLGTNVVALCYWMFAFLRMSTTSATARGEGSSNVVDATQQLNANLWIAFFGGILLLALQTLLLPWVMTLMTQDAELYALALDYCHIRIYSAPAVLLTYVAMGWLIGMKHTKVALLITVFANALNVLLDYVFIVRLDFDVQGAAAATLIAEYTACVIALGFVLKQLYRRQLLQYLGKKIHRELFLSTFSVNSDLFLRTLAILFTFNFFHAQGAAFGDDILAANAIIIQWVLFTAFFLDGYALAAETLTANAVGARDERRFHYASFAALWASFVIALGITLVYALCYRWALPLFTSIPSVQTQVMEYSFWLLAMPLISTWCYALDGIYVGAGKTRVMRNHMAAALFIVFLPAWWIFKPLHNHGLWLAIVLFNGFRGLSLGLAYWTLSRRHAWFSTVYKEQQP
ncbi:DNA damage-inducible protein F [Thalassocella blandensis]|nr:DNA damage-inducible protein F [Thalassocella blandensis]